MMTDFFEVVQSYLCEYMPKQKCVSSHTQKSHKDTLNLLISYLRSIKNMKIIDITFEKINRQLIVDFLDWLTETRQISKNTRRQRLSVLRTFFAYAGEVDCTNVALEQQIKRIPLGRQKGRTVEYFTDKALKAILEQPNIQRLNGQRDQFFMSLLYDTGARVSELRNMKICDIKIETEHPIAYLRGKGDKVRVVPIMKKTAENCKGYLNIFHRNTELSSTDFLFYTNLHDKRHQLSSAAIGKFVKKYGEVARLVCADVPERVHPHQFRHTRAIHLYRDGYPLVLVGEFLGHVDPSTTKIYAYADAEMKRNALEKASIFHGDSSTEFALWEDDEDLIMQLVGLK
jgi:site-specific recombinase XerD